MSILSEETWMIQAENTKREDNMVGGVTTAEHVPPTAQGKKEVTAA